MIPINVVVILLLLLTWCYYV